MPGFEHLGDEELTKLHQLFSENGGVLFSIAADRLRKGSIYFTRDFEDQFKTRISIEHAQAVSSGTAALYIALKALGVGPGDEVITSVFNFIGDTEAILLTGATPRLTEIGDDLQLDPLSLENSLSLKTKAIVVPHMMGEAAPLQDIFKISRRANLPVIEDACQALGATLNGQSLGTFGEIGFYSFDYGKIITCGEGGMLVTRDKDLHRSLNELHNHGRWSHRRDQAMAPSSRHIGFNFRLTEMQAAVASAQLQKFDMILKRTRQNFSTLESSLKNEIGSRVKFRPLAPGCERVGDVLVFSAPDEKAAQMLKKKFDQAGIGLKILPSDLTWHFGKKWDHVWSQAHQNHPKDMGFWEKSESVLKRSIGLTIWSGWDQKKCVEISDLVSRLVKDVL